ncbi:MAG: sugar phosphate isomerase/epimerase family protein [Armatimonadota bacterium]|nr:sugar phosphate isomerase/epimerase family protein [Armatimonadota bacterium]
MKIALYLAAPGSRFWTAATPLSLEAALARASALGYDAVEIMPTDFSDPDPATVAATAARCGLEVLVIASGFLAVEHGLTFTHPDAGVRRRAVEGVTRCVDIAVQVGAPFVSVGIVRGKLVDGASRAEAAAHLAACLREAALYAGARGITLALEPGNRYETDFVHTVREALDLLAEVGLPSLRLLVDTFHMNIEEASIPDAVRLGAAHLVHVHFADSNRRAPGWGHLDFGAVARALREIGYAGAVGLEMSLAPGFEAAAGQGLRFVRALLPPR